MKFVHFWDDNIVAPVVVVTTTAIATMGSMFLGIGHPTPSAVPAAAPAPVTVVETQPTSLDGLPEGEDLCERVTTKEDDIDHMNAEIDALMVRVKHRVQKSRGSNGAGTTPQH
jgi:hypothetical protein